MYLQNGSFLAFNKSRPQFSFKNQQYDFYLPSYEHLQILFTKPIRPNLDNQFITILYSDLWGDYWGYFVFVSRDLALGRGQMAIGDYLARVNIVSLIPTLIMLVGLYNFKRLNGSKTFHGYIIISALVSFFGYLWFLVMYPELPTGDTIKSSYIIQLFHLIAIVSASYLEDLQKTNLKRYSIVIFLLTFCYFHNFSAYLSHFPIKF